MVSSPTEPSMIHGRLASLSAITHLAVQRYVIATVIAGPVAESRILQRAQYRFSYDYSD